MTSKSNINKPQERKYGLLSMLSLIVGIVVGSGLFVKNQSSFDASQSTLVTITGWMFIGIIVIFMAFAFIEIASISKIKKEPGTLHSWATDLINPKVGRLIGYFFVFVYLPILIVALSSYSANELMNSVHIATDTSLIKSSIWGAYTVKVAIAAFFLIFFAMLNMLTSKPGKAFQVSGTIIMSVPVVLLTLISIVVISLAAAGIPTHVANEGVVQTGSIWDPNSVKNQGMQDNGLFKIFILALPGIMFTYDGFVWAAALQNESESQNTFKLALSIGIVLICVMSIALSWSIFAIFPYKEINGIDGYQGASMIGQEVNGELVTTPDIAQLSITSAMTAIFPNAQWVGILMSLVIVIAIFNTLSGTTILAARNLSSLSEKNVIYDKDGKYLKRNKALVPHHSAKTILYVTLFWLVTLTTIDAINLAVFKSAQIPIIGSSDLMTSTNYALDVATIISYTISVSLLVAGLVNRKTKKVKTEKVKAYVPFAVISCIVIALITAYYAYLTINPIAKYGEDAVLWYEWLNWGMCMIVLSTMITTIISLYWFFGRELKNLDKKHIIKKKTWTEKFFDLEYWVNKESIRK